MARKVKCALTKESGTSDVFYKAENGKYYKSKELYDTWHLDVQKRTQARNLLLEYMDWQEGEPFPTLLLKKLKELDYYSGQVVLDTVRKCASSLEWAIKNKNFLSTTSKIHYVFAIISNNIADVNKQNTLHKEYEKKREHNSEETLNANMEIVEIGTTTKGKDISDFLEDELWS